MATRVVGRGGAIRPHGPESFATHPVLLHEGHFLEFAPMTTFSATYQVVQGVALQSADEDGAIPASMADGAPSPRSRRSIFIVLGSIAGLVVVAAVGGYLVLRHFGPDLRATGVAIEREATEFGKAHTAQECITEALTRETRDADFMGGVKARLFLKYCLGKTERPAGFCDGVPRDGDIMPTVQWALAACASHGKAGDETCSRTMQSVIEVCSGK